MYAHVFKEAAGHKFHGNQYTNVNSGMGSTMGITAGYSGLLASIHKPDGGFTYSFGTGRQPKVGYPLSIYPERSKGIPFKDFHRTDVSIYIKKNKDILSKKESHLGGWHDPKTGMIYLDISVVKKTAKEAHDLALKYDQIAYFDLSIFKSVTVNAKATSGGANKMKTKKQDVTKSDKPKLVLTPGKDITGEEVANFWSQLTGEPVDKEMIDEFTKALAED
jgi:hypothetical protein